MTGINNKKLFFMMISLFEQLSQFWVVTYKFSVHFSCFVKCLTCGDQLTCLEMGEGNVNLYGSCMFRGVSFLVELNCLRIIILHVGDIPKCLTDRWVARLFLLCPQRIFLSLIEDTNFGVGTGKHHKKRHVLRF